jgi:uncharacterized membrane protein YqiK
MDLNQLFFDHQVALIGAQNAASAEARRQAGRCAAFLAQAIRRHGEAEGHRPGALVLAPLG